MTEAKIIIEIILLSILVILSVSAVIHRFYEIWEDHKWKKLPLRNFQFIWHGIKYWFSRSCAVVLFTFCKDKDGKLYVLANKRGEGTPDFQGCWNAPCGYLDFNEDGKTAALRETKEECGIDVPRDKVKLVETASSPRQNRQNVTLRHIAMLDGTIDDYKFNTDGMEENEVDDVAWIPVDNESLLAHEWAFDHGEIIRHMCELVKDYDNIRDSSAF